jgi:hypothetical protein
LKKLAVGFLRPIQKVLSSFEGGRYEFSDNLLIKVKREHLQKSIPYAVEPVKVRQTSRRMGLKEGVRRPFDRFAWLTDGPLRPIENGLPMCAGKEMSHNYNEVIHGEERIKAIEMDIRVAWGDEGPLGRSRDDIDIPADYSPTRLLSCRKRQAPPPSTGLTRVDMAPDLIDCMGKLHIKSVATTLKRPPDVSPFFKPQRMPRIRERPKSTVALVRSQMDRVFRPGCEPFRNVDTDDDFPIDDLDPPTPIDTPPDERVVEDYNKIDAPSKLIDSSVYDVFWTKCRAPFTREDCDVLYSWRLQDDRITEHQKQKRIKMLKDREAGIRRTFQSRMAFEEEMNLVDEACDQVATLGPGKAPKGRESTWIKAARVASVDISSLPCRKVKWSAYIEFVKHGGGAQTELERKFALGWRAELMSGENVSEQMFWNVLDLFEPMDFAKEPLLHHLEFLRNDMGIERESLIAYFEERDITPYFYNLSLRK